MNFKSILTLISITFFIAIKSYSQGNSTDIVVGKNYKIVSKILNETRGIQVYIPDNYSKEKNRSYPVLYVLDGQEYFMHGVAYQNMLRFRDKSPGFIVVGINTDRHKRRNLFYKESKKFTSFLKRELIPFIDTNFRTKKEKERLYFGWEMAGGLGFELLANQINLFSGYFIASPTHSTEKRMNALKNMIIKKDKFLLITSAPEERWITKDTAFLSILKNHSANKLWRYSVLEREDHYSTPLKTIHEGLSDYFTDYKPIRLRTLKAYDDYGGLAALKVYYNGRGVRYDLSTEIHKETKHFLLLNAMKEDNYKRFDYYANEFDGYIETNTRDLWFDRYARFYLKHHNIEKALYLYQYGINKLPNSSMLYEGIGTLYKRKKDNKKALRAFTKALELDSNNSKARNMITLLKDAKD